MRIVLLTLAVASSCLALPAAQENPSNLDSLINSVFGKPPQSTQPPTPTTDRNLDVLISDVFGPKNSSGTILGVNNKPTTNPDCVCVPYYQCRDGKILADGTGLIDIRSGFVGGNTVQYQGSLGPCENYLDVCCQPPDRVPDITPKPKQRKGCGERHPEGVGFRITGDTDGEAQFGEFPWMVAITKQEMINNNDMKLNVYQCGGALIHRSAVLTAAHCVNGKQPGDLKVRAGEWDTQTKNEVLPHQDRNVDKVIVHPNFQSGSLANDFAILILSEPMTYADNVDVVCLPDRNVVFDGARCFASGWGKDKFGKEGHYQVILKKVELPVVPHDTCQRSLRSTRLGAYFVLDDSFICAGGEPGKDTCKGDGGSPLVCPLKEDPTRYAQAGIVAWGIGCGDGQAPGVYASTAYARDWIDEQLAFHNLDNTVYQYQR